MSLYSKEISRANKGCFVFLLDQSYSMEEPLGNSAQRKCDELCTAINAWLRNMTIRASGDTGIKDWLDVAVIGYRTDDQANAVIESALQGPLAGKTLLSIKEIGENPASIDSVTQTFSDEETGENVEMPMQVPVWVTPRAEGGTPMCHVFDFTFGVLEEWINNHPHSFPPIVINITDGESQDGDPVPYADALKQLATSDGSVLLFNCHLSMTAADSFMFPASCEVLPDALARSLFDMSSPLPEPILTRANGEGFELLANARGMAFNADMVSLIKFLDLGTRPAQPTGLR
jgi:hypothetical protein